MTELRACADPRERVGDPSTAQTPQPGHEVARTIWLYWEGPLPDYLALCIETIRTQNPTATVTLLDWASFAELRRDDLDIDLDRLTPVKRSDFIRAYVLREFGGLYVDVDCVGLKPFEPAFQAAECSGFTVVHQDDGELQTNFMASVKAGPVVSELYDGICQTLRSGRKLDWLDLATVPLMPAIERHRETTTLLPTNWVAPIHWSEPLRFFEEDEDTAHANKIDEDALGYMLSNDMITTGADTKHMRDRSSGEILSGRSFLSFLLRRALGLPLLNAAI